MRGGTMYITLNSMEEGWYKLKNEKFRGKVRGGPTSF